MVTTFFLTLTGAQKIEFRYYLSIKKKIVEYLISKYNNN